MRFGVHATTGGGLVAAVDYASGIGCECVQVFAKSPMQWKGPRHSAEDCAAFREALAAAGLPPAYTHTAYLLNLSGLDDDLRMKSARALADELVRAEDLGAAGVVTHVGTFADGDAPAAARRLRESLAVAREESRAQVRVLLENSAGAGTLFLADPDQYGLVFSDLGDDHGAVGVCLDTCHAHAAGHDLSGPEGWGALLDALDAAVGPGAIGLVHANDCMHPAGSHRDRHDWIGRGTIGESGFAAMVAQTRLTGCDVVMEMPGEAPEKDVVNLMRLKALRASCGACGS